MSDNAKKPKRLKRQGWIQVGINALRTPADSSHTMEGICTHAGKTRGSFYFHFADIEDFWLSVARYWQEEFTDRLIAATSNDGAGTTRLDQLNTLAARLDPAIEQGMRILAVRQPGVADVVRRVDRARKHHLEQLYLDAGLPQERAQAIARIEYAAFVGMQQTEPEITQGEMQALYRDFLHLTGR